MAKAPSTRRTKPVEPAPFDKRKVDLTKFKPDISAAEWKERFKRFGNFDLSAIWFQPIETLSCTKTVGSGETNLTIIMPTIVQVDAATPYAGFNRQTTPSRNPIIQMHFQPGAYGITSAATYVMAFALEVSGQSTFNLSGYAGSGSVTGTGSRVLSGQVSVSLVFHNVPASQVMYGYVEQTAGAQWNWFSTRVSFPPLVIQL
jgi:hypothetical protein